VHTSAITIFGIARGSGRSTKPIALNSWREGADKARRSNRRLKLKVYEAYGNRCICCGEDNLGFLSIDHINGGGRAHRKEVGGGVQLWRLIIKAGFPADYQLLCYNCNLGRYHNGGICPHKSQASDAA